MDRSGSFVAVFADNSFAVFDLLSVTHRMLLAESKAMADENF